MTSHNEPAPAPREGHVPVARVAVFVVAIVALFVAAALLPLPELADIRRWSVDLGPWFVVVFFVVHAVACIFPIPRSTFTYAASVLFAPMLALAVCLVASAISAGVAFSGIRRFGYDVAAPLRRHPRLDGINTHLSRRGWAAVLSLRMVPAVPFSVLNYAAALTPMKWRPFLVATLVGSLPGTVAAIIFGNSLTTGASEKALVATVVIALLGLAGLVVDSRVPTRPPKTAHNEDNDGEGAPEPV